MTGSKPAASPAGLPAALPLLTARLASTLAGNGTGISAAPATLPERVLQFGEGNFLRAFVDWMLERMNQRGVFDGRAIVVQPLPTGAAAALTAQDACYTVILRGLVAGRIEESRQIVSAVSRAINPYTDFDGFLACAAQRELRFVVSNTTEAGIRVDPEDRRDSRPAPSFPGKLTQFLLARFEAFQGARDAGLIMLPCELIEDNGVALRAAVLATAKAWGAAPAFVAWIEEACVFASTLVDRIVTGYPAAEASGLEKQLGYRDPLMVAGEVFHAWVIAAPPEVRRELPFAAAGLNVVFTEDLRSYRERKVRILNGAHTTLAAIGLLDGQPTVRACMEDPRIGAFVARVIDEEILPTLSSHLPHDELQSFARQVAERFRNPFIDHRLASIALNSLSKYRARILGTVRDHLRASGNPPPRLTLVLAALIALHGRGEVTDGESPADEPSVVAFFRAAWREAGPRPSPEACRALVGRLLSREDFWGEDLVVTLPGFDMEVATRLHELTSSGVRAVLERVA